MHLSRHALTVVGLLAVPSWAATQANMKIWDVDNTCTHYPKGGSSGGTDQSDFIKVAFDEALPIAQAALQSIEFVAKNKRPDKAKDKDGFIKWVRISEAMGVTFGFYPDPDKVEFEEDPEDLTEEYDYPSDEGSSNKGSDDDSDDGPDEDSSDNDDDSNDSYWITLFGIFGLVERTLPASENFPAHSFFLTDAPSSYKPMLTCGMEGWKWVDLKDKIPGQDTVLFENYNDFKPGIKKGVVGGWFKNQRWIFQDKKANLNFCDGVWAGTMVQQDLIVFCDVAFSSSFTSVEQRPSVVKSSIEQGKPLLDYMKMLSSTLFHELMHWYGGLLANGQLNVDDQQAVNDKGELVYKDANGQRKYVTKRLSDKEAADKGWKRVNAYSMEDVWNLAKPSSNSYSGPKFATRNAESLTLFAMMMYYDQWQWAQKGIAGSLDKLYTQS